MRNQINNFNAHAQTNKRFKRACTHIFAYLEHVRAQQCQKTIKIASIIVKTDKN